MKKNAKFWVIIALVICLISSLGASVFQTNFGSVDYQDLTITTDSGHTLDALLLIPENATAETPAPAIVVSHGWYNNREMQDLNYVEYARRGYVVMAISMYGHGDSEIIETNTWWDDENNANGLYDAVKYVSRLDCVDASRIGVTGHSNGARASREAVLQDDEGLIAAALLVSNDAVYYDEFDEMAQMSGGTTGNFYNMFGSRDAAIVACQYDEFFHRVDGNPPREFIHQVTAQSFLYFGTDPAGREERQSYTYYTQEVDGEEAIRAIFNPAITHPWAHFSASVVASSVEFFDKALGAPVQLAHNNQIWQWKAAFNALGIVGFFMFVTNFAILALDIPFFKSLKAEGEVLPAPARDKKARGRYIRSQLGSTVYSIITFFLAFILGYAILRPGFLNQEASRCIGYWCVLTGLLTLGQMRRSKRKFGVDSAAMGARPGWAVIFKSALLAVLVVAAAFAIVFVSDALLLTDYRLWCFATIRAFRLSHLGMVAKFLPMWLLYYIPLSVSTNCYNYVDMGGCKFKSVLLTMFWVALAPAIMIVAQYAVFFTTGFMITEMITGIAVIWLFPIIVILPLAAYICHKIYLKTRNPYIGGIIMGLIACILTVTNTLTG